MGRIFGILCALGLGMVGAGTGLADEQAEGRALVDRAIKALGGRTRLSRLPAVTGKTKGSFEQGGVEVAITGDLSIQDLEHFRWDMQFEVQGRSIQICMIVAGTKGWFRAENKTRDIPADLVTLLREDLLAVVIAQRLWLLREKAYKLSPLGEIKIRNREAVGVKISRQGYADIDLYFDKQTMLPIKSSVRLKEGKDSEEAVHEFFYRDFKKTRGIPHFTKVTFRRDEKKVIAIELNDISLEEKLDAGLFAKP